MSKVMQNIILLMDNSEDTYNNTTKGGNMLLNRFCIDEDAAFESSVVHYLKDISNATSHPRWGWHTGREYFFLKLLNCFSTHFIILLERPIFSKKREIYFQNRL